MLSTGNLVADFANWFSDLQIVFGNPALYGAEGDSLLGEMLCPMAPPEIAAQIAGPQDMMQFTLIEVATHRAGWPHLFEQLRLPHGSARYFFADNSLLAAELAASGVGIALARAPASDRAMFAAGLVPCLPDIRVKGQERYHLVYPDRSSLRPAARQFRDWLLDLVQDACKQRSSSVQLGRKMDQAF